MEGKAKKISQNGLQVLLFVFIAVLLSSCAVPKIVILNDPLSVEEHVNLGYIYEKKGNLDLAEEEYKKAIKKDKENYIAYFNLGNVYAKKGDYKKAEKYYKRAIKLKEDPDVMNNLAYVLHKQGKNEEALKYIKRALELKEDPSYRDTLESILKE
jgi:Tfp pilus assembly protein PilF